MEAIFAIIGGALLVWLMSRIRHHESQDEEEYTTTTVNEQPKDTMNDNINEYEGMDTPTLVRAILKKLNCLYDENEDGSLFFTFQSERFWVQASKDTAWIRIIDLQWYDCDLSNIEEISCMQKVINTANAGQQCTAVYYIDKEENKMNVYSKCDLLITSQFPVPDQYFSAWLNGFFRLKQTIVMEFEKEKQKIETN